MHMVVAVTHQSRNVICIKREDYLTDLASIRDFALAAGLITHSFTCYIAEHFEVAFWSNLDDRYGLNMCHGVREIRPVEAIKKFGYFISNFNEDFIEQCWSDDKHMADHLREKMHGKVARDGANYITSNAFMNWWYELDAGNQRKLSDYIIENFKG